MVSIITIYTNTAVIMTMVIVAIKKFKHCMSIAIKTMTKFLKSLKRQFLLLFQDDKRTQKFHFCFSFKNRSFFIILPTKFISLNCTASQNSLESFLINKLYEVSGCGFESSSTKEFLDIQATIECGFTLKRVRDMIRTYSQMHRTDKYSQHSSIIWPVWLNG